MLDHLFRTKFNTYKKYIVFFAFSLCPALLNAENNAEIQLNDIIRKGQLTIAIMETDNPPFYMTDSQGHLIGFDIDYGKKIAQMLNVKPVFVRKGKNCEEMIDSIARGEADIAISKITFTAERSKKVLFSDPYLSFKKAFLFNRFLLNQLNQKDKKFNTLKNLFQSGVPTDERISIHLLSESSDVLSAQCLFPDVPLTQEKNWEKLVNEVSSGTYLCVFRDEVSIKKYLLKYPKNNLYLLPVTLKDEFKNLHIVSHQKSPPLITFINNLIKNTKMPTVDSLLKQYHDYLKTEDQNV